MKRVTRSDREKSDRKSKEREEGVSAVSLTHTRRPMMENRGNMLYVHAESRSFVRNRNGRIDELLNGRGFCLFYGEFQGLLFRVVKALKYIPPTVLLSRLPGYPGLYAYESCTDSSTVVRTISLDIHSLRSLSARPNYRMFQASARLRPYQSARIMPVELIHKVPYYHRHIRRRGIWRGFHGSRRGTVHGSR